MYICVFVYALYLLVADSTYMVNKDDYILILKIMHQRYVYVVTKAE